MGFEPLIHLMKELHGKINTSVFGAAQGGQNSQQAAFLRQLQREIKAEETMSIPLDELKVVVFDIETTGFFPDQGNDILSIGAIKVKGCEVYEDEVFYSLINHEESLADDIKNLTGLSEDELKVAPPASQVLLKFFEFAKDHTLVAHHATHEKSFMQHASWKLFKTPFKHRIVDTSFLYRIVEPSMKFVRLEDWCEHNQITVKDRHHALGDAKLTADLWSIYLSQVKNLGCRNLRDIYERLSHL
ncbi:exonuclease domain-containing protein [Metabacillus arenae]|uniref:3'-5' exoribonuclease n=1 Tax=Metabacillus arenae TaxID=2771434 RepID=A0A926NG63_9BACI|nr:exonuclease domain-containing protein [Metabacillus arenae]MBD1380500.1 3'-5' exoribonuclease [Metabacillus arenae]